jgi:uncharacterized phiE125 gp8 family phage protein
MWYPATVSAQGSAVIDLSEAKAHLRVDFDDDDAIISGLIFSAQSHVEKYCGIRLSSQTIVAKCDSFDDMARLPEAPVSSVSSITYIDTDGASQTLATSVYEVRADQLEVSVVLKYGQLWPSIQPGSRITLTAVVGYASVPDTIRHAMLLLIGSWYENREAASAASASMPFAPSAFDALLANERRYA